MVVSWLGGAAEAKKEGGRGVREGEEQGGEIRWGAVVLGGCSGGGLKVVQRGGATKKRNKATMVLVMGGDFQFCLLVLGFDFLMLNSNWN